MEHLSTVKALCRKSVDVSGKDVFGFHGTSIEAIKHLAIHGAMPSTGLTGPQFHFCPKRARYYEGGPYHHAAGYAEINGTRNLLLARMLSICPDLDPSFMHEVLSMAEIHFDAVEDENIQILDRIQRCLGMTCDAQFSRYVNSLKKKRPGVILGIRKKILKLSPETGVDEDLFVTPEGGLAVDFISGIRPLGKFEEDEILRNEFQNVQLLN